MLVLDKIVLSTTEPPQTNVLWIKPFKSGVEFCAFFNGKWQTIDAYESKPGPNTVGTEQIIDNSVIMDDLNSSVRSKINKTYVQQDESMHMEYDEVYQHTLSEESI